MDKRWKKNGKTHRTGTRIAFFHFRAAHGVCIIARVTGRTRRSAVRSGGRSDSIQPRKIKAPRMRFSLPLALHLSLSLHLRAQHRSLARSVNLKMFALRDPNGVEVTCSWRNVLCKGEKGSVVLSRFLSLSRSPAL